MEWYAADGTAMGEPLGRPGHPGRADVRRRGLDGRRARRSLVVNGGAHEHEVTLPAAPGVTAYRLLWDSDESARSPPGEPQPPGPVTVPGTSLRVYAAADVT